MSLSKPQRLNHRWTALYISVLQSAFLIFERSTEALLPVIEELGIGQVAYSPLARGFLSGAVKPRDHYDATDFRQYIPWWAPGSFDANTGIVAELTESKDVT